MEQPTETLTPPSPNGTSPDDLMRIIVRQHRIINNLKDQLASVLLGLAETQATLEETRDELNVARADLERLHGASLLPSEDGNE